MAVHFSPPGSGRGSGASCRGTGPALWYDLRMAQRTEESLGPAGAGRFLIVGLPGNAPGKLPEIKDFLDTVEPLGVVLFERNLPDLRSTLELTEALLGWRQDLVVAIDHEGGRVHRLPPPFTRFPPALVMARSGNPGLIREAARAQARELRAAGIDVNFAPVLDIHTNPDNPVIGDRAFGTTPEEVVHHALPYLQGLAEGGVLGCGKHFPGHGDTSCDSHVQLPRVEHEADRLRAVEMAPFARAVEQGVAMIMTAHVLFPALDPERPASLSAPVIDGILRRIYGFGGMVVSDDLNMGAITGSYSVADSAVAAIAAGSDAVLVCQDPDSAVSARDALQRAIEEGHLPPDLVQASDRRRARFFKRVRRMRRIEVDRSWIGADAHRRLAEQLAQPR
ncbi:MAG: beta-N-acetylhexosaminidase [Candidatus Dadabacteria bacterium]|nr:MAG: beta-N-acetylhexosaminidase [Candidatus Dadabacteria bacterium]